MSAYDKLLEAFNELANELRTHREGLVDGKTSTSISGSAWDIVCQDRDRWKHRAEEAEIRIEREKRLMMEAVEILGAVPGEEMRQTAARVVAERDALKAKLAEVGKERDEARAEVERMKFAYTCCLEAIDARTRECGNGRSGCEWAETLIEACRRVANERRYMLDEAIELRARAKKAEAAAREARRKALEEAVEVLRRGSFTALIWAGVSEAARIIRALADADAEPKGPT